MNNRQMDQNGITVGSAISSVDGVTILPLLVDPVSNKLIVDLSAGVYVATLANRVKIDQNRQNTFYGVSDVDGVTLVPIRTDNNGNLLCKF